MSLTAAALIESVVDLESEDLNRVKKGIQSLIELAHLGVFSVNEGNLQYADIELKNERDTDY